MPGEMRWLTQTSHDRTKEAVAHYYAHHRGTKSPFPGESHPVAPQIVRLGKLYGPVIAATFDSNKTLTKAQKCEVLLHRIRKEGSAMEPFGTKPEVAYWIFEEPGEAGNEVICLRDHSINDPAHPNNPVEGWTVFPLKPSGGGDVPSICLGMNTSTSGDNSLTTDGSSKFLTWAEAESDNSDTSVFDFDLTTGAGKWQGIRCKVAGKYRCHYHIDTVADTTHTASQIVRASVQIVKVDGGTFAETIVPRSTMKLESLHIDGVDMPVGLGAYNGQTGCESQMDMGVNDFFVVRLLLSTGNPRGIKVIGESFGAQLVKRA